MTTFQAREAPPPALLLDDRGKPATGTGSGLSWSALKPFLSASPGRMLGLAGSSALGGLAEAAILVILVQLAVTISGDRDVVRGNGPLGLLEGAGVGTLFWIAAGLTVLRLLFQALNAHLTARMSSDTVRRLRRETYGAFIDAQWSVKATEKDGHLQDLMSTHISRSANAVIVVSLALGALFSFASLMVSAVAVSPIASVIIIATTAVLFYVLRPLSGLTRRYSSEQARINLEYVNVVSESVAVAQELEVFDAGRAANARVMRLVDEFARWWYRNHVVSDFVRPLYQSLAVLLILGGLAALSSFDSVTIGSLGAVVVILVRALNYSSTLQSNHTKLCELLPYMEVVAHARDTYRNHAVERGGSPLERIESLAFEDVGFAYRPGHPVLKGVTFAVRPGEAIGIIGPSGAGKSTLVQLLLRLRQPTSGQYLVNGLDAATFDRSDWFRRVALVAQDNRLVSGTVRDNIRFFRDWIDDDAVERAAKMAQIHDDITSWAQGYDTPVGQRAGAVSGGQRQRICLARALAGEPDVIVLDEPTSALDVRSESLVHAALEDLKGHVTLFIVAHRLSTLNTCDRIMVFGNGELQAFGSRRSLQRGNRFYREAVELSQLR